ncbi:hypothetical protein CC80DRAFT_595493 [Byssothecium circinans]|uniref:ZN622/Rei1/Reh1 zinc finger C2H2-type domain-containing protein n=1 Tax=Byssothecium circinans TaxID=147558 RepID=A0A6A5TPQ6_9PLEO|nr:hypothetical protein CC80DRAFT_595493 [Byssothecium circinans]
MKDAWHVKNLKRKLVSLPPLPRPAGSPPRISVEFVNHQHKHSPGHDTPKHGSSREASDNEDDEYVSPFECLFCSEAFEPVGASDDESSTCLDRVIEHMRTAHGFTIPQQESITDLEIFLEYLGTVVKLWHECLYCGASGSSTRGIQNHKRHCQLNLEREPELLEFWDRDDASKEEAGKEEEEGERGESTKVDGISTANLVSDTEIRLSSGKILGSRRAPTARKPRPTYSSTALVKAKDDSPLRSSSSQPEPHPKIPDAGAPKDRRMIRRGDMMGIIGLQEHQHRALAYAEKAAQHREVTARKRH